MTMQIYVGIKSEYGYSYKEVFRYGNKPTEQSHGHLYNCVIGPFRTIRGAKVMIHYGSNNPHLITTSDAERIGKKYEKDLNRLPKYNTLHY